MSIQIGNYIIDQQIGKGLSSIVFKAYKMNTNELVAIKQYKGIELSQMIKQNELILQFEKECKFLSYLNLLMQQGQLQLEELNYINKLLDTFKMNSPSVCFLILVTEFATNGDLGDFLFQIQCLPGQVAAIYIEQAAKAVKLLHNLNIAHMDIKTPNMLLDDNFKLKLTDFGLIEFQSEAHVYAGTRGYMAPEVSREETYCPKKADIFSLGCTFLEIKTGITPFGNSQPDLNLQAYKDLQENPEEFWKYIEKQVQQLEYTIDIEVEFKDLIQRMLNNVPNKRPSIQEVLNHPYFSLYQQVQQNQLSDFMKKQLLGRQEIQSTQLATLTKEPQKNILKQGFSKIELEQTNLNTFIVTKNQSDDKRQKQRIKTEIIKFFDSIVQTSDGLIFPEDENEEDMMIQFQQLDINNEKQQQGFKIELHRRITNTNKTCQIGLSLKETEQYFEFRLIGLKGDYKQQNELKKQFRKRLSEIQANKQNFKQKQQTQ